MILGLVLALPETQAAGGGAAPPNTHTADSTLITADNAVQTVDET